MNTNSTKDDINDQKIARLEKKVKNLNRNQKLIMIVFIIFIVVQIVDLVGLRMR